MKNSDMMLAAVSSGDGSDGTVSAALDALREDASCDYLGAVLAVARAWRAGEDARTLKTATEALAVGGPYRETLLDFIRPYMFPHTATTLDVYVVDGDFPPWYPDPTYGQDDIFTGPMQCSVGARWILRVLEEQVSVADPPRMKRKRKPKTK